MVTRMDALFLIDRDARERQLNFEQRHAQRSEFAEEWLREIRQTAWRCPSERCRKVHWVKRRPTP